jgi:hypothetical protein
MISEYFELEAFFARQMRQMKEISRVEKFSGKRW